MACRGFWEFLLKVLNFLLILLGLTMIGYGVFTSAGDDVPVSPSSGEFVQLGRPMLLVVSLADNILDKLHKTWFIYLFTGIGSVILLIACCGCIRVATRNGCCLTCALVFLLALIGRAANRPAEYDSDEEYIGGRRQQIQQPLINRPVAPGRNDGWSTRMREKYGLDTSEVRYNPSESNRNHQQAEAQSTEEGSRCSIM